MEAYGITMAAVILVCLGLGRVSGRVGVPALALFILLGMAFGSDGIVQIHFDDFVTAERVCSVALIFIIFYGGFGTSWTQARPVALAAGLLSSVGVVLTAGMTGLFCWYALGLPFWESMLIGSVISSTDAASVFSILRSKKLALKYGTASMLEVESGSNDPFSYMLTIFVLSIMKGDFSYGALPGMLAGQIGLGAACGVATGLAASWTLSRVRIVTEGFEAMLVFAMALVAYAGADCLGGNGYLGVYLCGIILGNRPLQNKKRLVHFFNGITGLLQICVFFLLGLLSFPSRLPDIALPALGIALFLTLVARPLAVAATLAPFRCPLPQQLLVSWTGLRGAASIVFAIMATVDPAQTQTDVFHITFFIVLFSVFIQGSLIPAVAARLHMIDPTANVMKTFSDYSEDVPLQFIQLAIRPGHPWADKAIRDIPLPPDLLLVMVMRGRTELVPKGDTRILPGDLVILSALSVDADRALTLHEIYLDAHNPWIGKTVQQIASQTTLIMAIKRNNTVLIPHGQTTLQKNDTLIAREE